MNKPNSYSLMSKHILMFQVWTLNFYLFLKFNVVFPYSRIHQVLRSWTCCIRCTVPTLTQMFLLKLKSLKMKSFISTQFNDNVQNLINWWTASGVPYQPSTTSDSNYQCFPRKLISFKNEEFDFRWILAGRTKPPYTLLCFTS